MQIKIYAKGHTLHVKKIFQNNFENRHPVWIGKPGKVAR